MISEVRVPVHRAPGGDLQEPISLDLIQIPFQMNLALDLVEHALFGFAILTVPGRESAGGEASPQRK